MAVRFQLKTGEGIPFSLKVGEPAFDIQNNKLYIGDNNGQAVEIGNSQNDFNNEQLERLQYYGDINITPTDVSYFKFSGVDTVNKTISIFGLSDAGLALTPVDGRLDIVIPYKHTIDNIEYTVNYVSLCEVIYDEDLRPSSKYNKLITSIIIPRTIKTIGFGGFCDHSFIRTVDVPDSVTTIGYNAFAGCDNLHEIRLTDNITEIEGNAFNSCPNLTIICSQGSYADTYAKKNGIKVKYDVIDSDNFINKISNNQLLIDGSELKFQDAQVEFSINPQCMNYSTEPGTGLSCSFNVDNNYGLIISGNPYSDEDITLKKIDWVEENDQSLGIKTTIHKLSKKANSEDVYTKTEVDELIRSLLTRIETLENA